MAAITWDQIIAGCDGYKAGLVKQFRKHEGLPTDEKDAQGRTVKVTASSFARHLGIPERTFREWTSTADTAALPAKERPIPSLDTAWTKWGGRMNALLMHGWDLADRTEATDGAELGAHAALAFHIYKAIAEKKIDAELRDLFDKEQAAS